MSGLPGVPLPFRQIFRFVRILQLLLPQGPGILLLSLLLMSMTLLLLYAKYKNQFIIFTQKNMALCLFRFILAGIFFIPYVICLFCVSIPMSILELCLGQMSNGEITDCWMFCRLFRNLWLIFFLVSLFVSLSYNFITTLGVWYLFACFYAELPWLRCSNWSSPC